MKNTRGEDNIRLKWIFFVWVFSSCGTSSSMLINSRECLQTTTGFFKAGFSFLSDSVFARMVIAGLFEQCSTTSSDIKQVYTRKSSFRFSSLIYLFLLAVGSCDLL